MEGVGSVLVIDDEPVLQDVLGTYFPGVDITILDFFGISNYLVLSATSQLNLQDGVVRAFGKAGLKGCILTKTDEATSLFN